MIINNSNDAPELFFNQKTNWPYKCDIWSFGVICSQIVVGKLPWKSDSGMEQNQSVKFESNLNKR